MIPALILVISAATLLQFFVSYCRSLVASSAGADLSEDARELTGIRHRTAAAEEFPRLMLLVGLCPEHGDDRFEVRAVRGYYLLLSLARGLLRRILPGAAEWTESERRGCAYYAAVALDRRIAFSRELMAQQVSNSL
ncbi:MAG: hypothetical protein L0387_22100 [Acidobacteria bacterium]|nr:hypothetical protein [Acidobacteriota bacterium]